MKGMQSQGTCTGFSGTFTLVMGRKDFPFSPPKTM